MQEMIPRQLLEIAVDEVGLQGSDGITANDLWYRVQCRVAFEQNCSFQPVTTVTLLVRALAHEMPIPHLTHARCRMTT